MMVSTTLAIRLGVYGTALSFTHCAIVLMIVVVRIASYATHHANEEEKSKPVALQAIAIKSNIFSAADKCIKDRNGNLQILQLGILNETNKRIGLCDPTALFFLPFK